MSSHTTTTTDDDTSTDENPKREEPTYRQHRTYEQDHWKTTHVERVDQIGAFETPTMSGDVRERECIRVDLDGYGHGGADTHGVGDNLQVSFWLTPETATELLSDLQRLVHLAALNGVDDE